MILKKLGNLLSTYFPLKSSEKGQESFFKLFWDYNFIQTRCRRKRNINEIFACKKNRSIKNPP